ncbi:MAG: diacylglycerol kinase family protein [bacterium]|nr:diacylglycerol kinase family protein [bacterium]MDE0289865.1 diacylglycerol kinase family protein [bacterium]MDE0436815.1 diacylglycerol kinase family protein [bacterium]
MKRILLCANPAASGFTGGLHRAVVSRLRRNFDVEAEWPRSAADTRAVSAAAQADGFELVVAMGGDGMVHHVANGIGGTGTPLGIVPVGTTNVLARLLGIPSRATKAADLICSRPPPRPAPAAMLAMDHGGGGMETRLATFACGAGFDAAVVQRAEQEPYRKYRLAGLHFARSAAALAWSDFAGRPAGLVVRSGDRAVSAVAVFVRLYDRYTYFGRVPVRFGARVPDTLGVLVARSMSRRRIPSILGHAMVGRDIGKVDGFEAWSGVSALEVSAPSTGFPAQADGELLGSGRSLSVSIQPNYLRVLMPG